MAARSPFWHAVLHFDTARILPWIALRNALGVALPLAIGVAAGNPSSGLVAATGALNVAFSDGSDPYRLRGRRILAASCFCALAVYAGRLCGHSLPLSIAVAAACAFAAGMMVATGQTATDIGSVTLVTLIVFLAQPTTPQRALVSGLLALAGGLLQTALALTLWPFQPRTPERRALAAFYAELARAASEPPAVKEAPPATAQSTDAQNALASLGGDHSVEAERYLALLAQAERVRLALLALARLRVRIGREPEIASESPVVEHALVLTARLLSAVAEALAAGRPAEPHPECLQKLRDLGESLRAAHQQNAMLIDARVQIDALAGQLRSALELSAHASEAGIADFERHESEQPWTLRLAGAFAMLQANLRWESAVLRHAVRLAACVVISDALTHALGFPRGYWAPMTAAIILRPDFTSTFSRGILRLAGTFIGLALSTVLFHFLTPSLAVQVALIAVFTYLLRCFGPANYGVLVAALSALVVLLFAIIGVSPAPVMAARALNTCLGGSVALLAYIAWPTWERSQVPEALARLLDAYRAYFQSVRDAYLRPDAIDSSDLDRTRQAARLARSNLEASVARLRSEPGVPSARLLAIDAILANSHRLIHAMMALEAGLYTSRPVPARDAFRTFANHVDLILYLLAAALRGSKFGPDALPDLREDHHALIQSGDPQVDRYALVNVETDRVTNSVNTLAEEILQFASVIS